MLIDEQMTRMILLYTINAVKKDYFMGPAKGGLDRGRQERYGRRDRIIKEGKRRKRTEEMVDQLNILPNLKSLLKNTFMIGDDNHPFFP